MITRRGLLGMLSAGIASVAVSTRLAASELRVAEDTLSYAVRLRMDRMQARLEAAGVRNLGFARDDAWNSLTLDERGNAICDTLEAWLDCDYTAAPEYDARSAPARG